MVGGRVLDHETLVAFDTLEDGRLLDGPLAHIGPVLVSLRILSLCVRRSPSRVPVISELFEEGSLEISGLWFVISISSSGTQSFAKARTVKVGSSIAEVVDDSTAELAEAASSAWTWLSNEAEETSAEASTALTRMMNER